MGHHNQDIDISEKFEFTGREKKTLIGLMLVGLVCLVLTYFDTGSDQDHHLRFWTNLLHNTVFFTGIAFIAMFLLAAKILAYSGWHTVWKRLLEAKAQFLIFGLVGMIIIWLGSKFGMHHLYHWDFPNITDEASACYDRIIGSKKGFLNSSFYLGATVIFGGLWYACVVMFRRLSLSEDVNGDESYSHHKKMKLVAAFYMPFGGFTSAALIWLWVMSIDSHWYSTMFAWYATASWLVSCVALLILTIIYLKSRGYFSYVTGEHLHDLGKYLFGFSVFWTYLWFSQFMLIWYANVGEETIYFDTRMTHYPALFWLNLLMNFVLPLFILVRNDAKRKFGILTLICTITLFGHWWDFFQMVKPGAQHTEHEWHGYDCAGESHHDTKELGQINESPLNEETNNDNYAQLASFQDEAHAEQGHSDAEHKEEGHSATEGHSEEHAHGHGADAAGEHAHGADAHTDGEHHHGDAEAENHEGAAHHHGEHHGEEGHGEHAGHGDGHGHDAHGHGPEFRMGFTIPGLLELGTFLGFLGLFFFIVFRSLSKAALVPPNDPYLGESLHHHVGYGGGNMEGDHDHH